MACYVHSGMLHPKTKCCSWHPVPLKRYSNITAIWNLTATFRGRILYIYIYIYILRGFKTSDDAFRLSYSSYGRARYDTGWHNLETTYLAWSCRQNGPNATTKNYDSLETWRREKTTPSPENLERWNIYSHEWKRSKNGRMEQSKAMEYESRGKSKETKSRNSVSDVNERRGGFNSLLPPWQALSSVINEEGTSVHSLSIFHRNLWQHCEVMCYHSGVAQCSKCSRNVTLCRWVNSSRGFGGICIFFRYGD